LFRSALLDNVKIGKSFIWKKILKFAFGRAARWRLSFVYTTDKKLLRTSRNAKIVFIIRTGKSILFRETNYTGCVTGNGRF
jgi:hypothetical protein